MLKGNERRVVVVERMSDPYFERAVLFVRCGAKPPKFGESLSSRAQTILDGMTDDAAPRDAVGVQDEKKRKKQRRLAPVVGRCALALLSAAAGAVVAAVFK